MATNPTLAQLRTTVRARLHLSANDPNFGDERINRTISEAASEVANRNPKGWWFSRYEITKQNTAGDLAVVPVQQSTPDPTRLIQKVGYVFCSLDGDVWMPIKQRTRGDALIVTGGRIATDGGLPMSWGQIRVPAVGGARNQLGIQFDPPLPNLAWTRIGAVVGNGDFTVDTDHLVWFPAAFVGPIVEQACIKLARQRRNVGQLTTRRRYITPVTMASTAYDAWMLALLRWYDSPYSGPGYATTLGVR